MDANLVRRGGGVSPELIIGSVTPPSFESFTATICRNVNNGLFIFEASDTYMAYTLQNGTLTEVTNRFATTYSVKLAYVPSAKSIQFQCRNIRSAFQYHYIAWKE